MPLDNSNIPRVNGKVGQQRFFDAVKDVLDVLTGKKAKAKYDRALTVRDLEKFGVDIEKWENCDKQNPYPL